jgi:hypothetical protein
VDPTEDVKASTAAFITFTPFRSWLHRKLARLSLIAAFVAEGDRGKRRLLPNAFFVRVSPRHFRRIGLPTDGPLRNGALLFSGTVGAEREGHPRGFAEALQGFDRIFSHCIDWLSPRFIARYRRPVSMVYEAHAGASTVRGALRVREALDETLEVMRSGASDEEFQRAYDRLTKPGRAAL